MGTWLSWRGRIWNRRRSGLRLSERSSSSNKVSPKCSVSANKILSRSFFKRAWRIFSASPPLNFTRGLNNSFVVNLPFSYSSFSYSSLPETYTQEIEAGRIIESSFLEGIGHFLYRRGTNSETILESHNRNYRNQNGPCRLFLFSCRNLFLLKHNMEEAIESI